MGQIFSTMNQEPNFTPRYITATRLGRLDQMREVDIEYFPLFSDATTEIEEDNYRTYIVLKFQVN